MAGRSAVGLDIGTSSVRAAELSFAKGRVTLEKFGQLALPPGAVVDGEVLDPPAVGAALKKLWSLTKLSSKKVVVGVANKKVIVRQVELPWMPPEELKGSLGFQVQDMLPMPVDMAILDFLPIEEPTSADGARFVRGLLVAAARDMVNGALSAVKEAGLRPVMVDLSSFAVLRSLAEPDHLGLDTRMEALVDVGARVTNVVVHEGGVPRFVRILLMGGQDVTDAVAERIGVPDEQAEAVKHQIGHSADPESMEATAARVVEVASSNFVDEIRGSLDYYTSTTSSAPLSRLVLTGGGSRLHGLAHRLELTTRLPVEFGNPMANLRVGRTGLSPEQLRFVEPLAVVPVGLAMGAAS